MAVTDEDHLRFTRVFFSSIFRLGSVKSFREATALGLRYVQHVKHDQYREFVGDLLSKPEYAGIIIDPKKYVADGLADQTPDLMVRGLVNDYQLSVDSASLVFAHSVLDAASFDYCRLIATLAPDEWADQVLGKKVELKEAMVSSPEVLLQRAIDAYFNQLEKESLLKKLGVLHAKCRPETTSDVLEGYRYDLPRLERLDQLRHYVVHGAKGKAALPEGDADIEFLFKTCWYLMSIVSNRYGVKLDLGAVSRGLLNSE